MTRTAKKPYLALDSSVAIHLLNEQPTAGQERAWADAQDMLELTDVYDMCLPSAVLAEVLGAVHSDNQRAASKRLTNIFKIQHYDREAAEIAATHCAVMLERSGVRGLGALAARFATTRQRLKVDLIILATAARWDSKLVVADGDFQKWKTQAGEPQRVLSVMDALAKRQQNIAFLDDHRKLKA